MVRTRVKICCIRSTGEAQMAVNSGADAVGFVAQRPPNPRTIADEEIAAIIPAVPPPVSTFLLTSERKADAISAHIRSTKPDTVQILPHLDQAEAARLAELEPQVRRVQVIHVEGPEALNLIPIYVPYVHAFLLDSGKPNAPVPHYGGTGRPHDWPISAEFVRVALCLYFSPVAFQPRMFRRPSSRCGRSVLTYAQAYEPTVFWIKTSSLIS